MVVSRARGGGAEGGNGELLCKEHIEFQFCKIEGTLEMVVVMVTHSTNVFHTTELYT